MGMFDSVYVHCPECGETNELQSKSGECSLHTYLLNDAPLDVMVGIDQSNYCKFCYKQFKLKLINKPVWIVIPDLPDYL